MPPLVQTTAPPHAQTIRVREASVAVLGDILIDDQTLDRALATCALYQGLNPLDRALARMMIATTLRRLGQIDDLLKRALEREEPPQPPALLMLLRLSLAQLLFMSIPPHAVVDVAVDTAVAMGLTRQKGLVNAVLRRLGRDGAAWVAKQNLLKLNFPAWMTKDWQKNFGAATTRAIAAASLEQAPIDLTIRDPSTIDHWAERLGAMRLPWGSVRLPIQNGAVDALAGYTEGAWWVQDAGASLAATILGSVKGRTIIDLCAAPGGKTLQLAAAGASVIAVDQSATRLATLRQNLDRTGLAHAVTVIETDAKTFTPPQLVDAVLLDAPCTATGTLRRHPDILHHRTADDVSRLAALQREFILQAARMIKPGGQLIYAVCSLQSLEGEAHLTDPAINAVWQLDPITADSAPGLEPWLRAPGYLRLMPMATNAAPVVDGFFIARFTRR
jgi:16S rRNA (cytosine967-C5)-methyltransferase